MLDSQTFVAPPISDVDPVIEAYKKDIDRTLIRENLKLTVEERFENLMRLQEFATDIRQAMIRATSPAKQ
jgi:hypothetical protein